MPALNKQTLFLSGKVYWAKVLGEPRLNYNGDGKEWTFEFEPDEEGILKLKAAKLQDRFKNKYEDRGTYITLKKAELNQEGKPNGHIRVYNEDNEDWGQDALIGNGSVVDVKLDVRDYGPGKKKGVYPVAIRVRELVPYVSSEFGGMDAENPAAAPAKKSSKKDTFKEDFQLDDEEVGV